MQDVHEIPIQKITPYIRYVNHLCCPNATAHINRIIYDHEFIFCLDGKATIYYDTACYTLTKGDLLYIKPNLKNQLIVSKGDTFYAHCVHFDWVLLDEQFNFTVEETYLNPQSLNKNDILKTKLIKRPSFEVSSFCIPTLVSGWDYYTIAPMFKELYTTYLQSDLSSRVKERAVFLDIISMILKTQLTEHNVTKNHYHQNTISHAIEYMKQHYNEAISVPSLAMMEGLSPKYFGNLFKSMTNMSVKEYLWTIRLLHAKRLLIETSDSIEEIANTIGICDVFYFTKLFKKSEGITPGRYRRMF